MPCRHIVRSHLYRVTGRGEALVIGLGAGQSYGSFMVGWKHNFEAQYLSPYTKVGYSKWYSSAGGVYASSCHNGVSAETNTLTQKYASASGYPAYQSFDFYVTTGDMVNWLAKINIPAISVLLTNHTDTEWTKNQKGIESLLKYYSTK